ncbi:MAG: DNA mismatch repair protein MutS [Chitinivibrionales bacterium]|nr:DNA mismatch repair protein MutS [Chitinivibrionales bacterium]
MKQYQAIKNQNPDTLLLYRMGDFYELFNEDARIASRILGITLTSRNHGGADNTPLAGFPYHALDRYANRLVKAGHKIAVCEQVEDPKTAKGIVKRDIIEIISAGTATDDSFIDEKTNNFILCLAGDSGRAGCAVCDLSTGHFSVAELEFAAVAEEIMRVDPSEIVIADNKGNRFKALIAERFKPVVLSRYPGWKFSQEQAGQVLQDHFKAGSLTELGLAALPAGLAAAGALLAYVKEQKRNDCRHIAALQTPQTAEFAQLDGASIRNLELLKPLHADDTEGTLIAALDNTGTPMGARLLRRFIVTPLKSCAAINERLDSVEWLKKDLFARGELELLLKQVADIERLIGRITVERANGRDVAALKKSLMVFPALCKLADASTAALIKSIGETLTGFGDIVRQIEATLVDVPPLSLRDGNLIRPGVSPELDAVRDAATNGKQWIARLQEEERKRTGIGSLKVGFNRVFGYYIEISKANAAAVPDDYIRKQTLVNGERFITPALKEMENTILGAEERHQQMEYELFCLLRKSIAGECRRIQTAAAAVALLDVLVTLAAVAAANNYCRPKLNTGLDFIIRDGRHPVVERMHPQDQYIPNHTEIRHDQSQILLITGPNMAGKSTYLRQNAIIALMAQMGSFTPASSVEIGVVDKFFTRVGASDRLARGQSTFLVEMIEVADILNNATEKSLILLDEVGRGTSTFDGISIAWAVTEYLHETPQRAGRTLFATHYHELTEMSLLFPRIKNLHVKVKEWNDQIIFLRKIDEGSCDHSYGIQVARLAGVPRPVIIRAREILANLESMELTPDHKPALARHKNSLPPVKPDAVQLDLIDSLKQEIIGRLKSLDINSLTPLEALTILSELKQTAEN